MDARRWQAVQKLFTEALERPSAERRSWLAEACGEDEALRREVSSLLAADAAAGESIVAAVRGGEELMLAPPPADEAPTLVGTEHAPLPTPPPDGTSDTTAGWRFGKYEILARLGQGGFGVVYRGHDPVLRRDVAIKTCSGADPGLRRRFYREGQIAAGLEHPNIVTVFELGIEAGVPYLVQELLGGQDLRELLPSEEIPEGDGETPEPLALGLERRLDILLQVARGLAHAHSAGVLHRDVKPANIRVLDDGRVKLLDFGIAKLLDADSQLTGTGTTLGTVGYLAPEQLRSEPLDGRADIFAFGVVAYELMTGRRPFRGENFSQVSYQLLYVEPEPLEALSPSCPPALARLVARCLAKEPALRPADFGQIATVLEALLGATEADPPALEPTGPAKDRAAAIQTAASTAAPDSTVITEAITADPATIQVGDPVTPTDDDLPTLAFERPPSSRRPLVAGAAVLALALALILPWARQDEPETLPPTDLRSGSTGRAIEGNDLREPTGATPADPTAPDLSTRQTVPGELSAPGPTAAEPRDDPPPGAASEVGQETAATTTARTDTPRDTADPASDLMDASPPPTDLAIESHEPSSTSSTPNDTAREDDGAAGRSLTSPTSDSPPPATTPSAPASPGVGEPTQVTESLDGPTPEPIATGPAPPDDRLDFGTENETEAESGAVDPTASLAEDTSSGDPAAEGTALDLAPDPGRPAIERGDFIVEGPGVEPPKLVGNFDPVYPRRARRLGREARVVVKVLVDENGRALQAIAPADEHGFGEAARRAALEARFAPATLDGVEGKMWMNLPFEFRLD